MRDTAGSSPGRRRAPMIAVAVMLGGQHDAAHRPQQPIGAGEQEQAKLVGFRFVAGGAVGPGFYVSIGVPACTIEPFVQGVGAARERLPTIKRVTVPSAPASTPGMRRSTRLQLRAASWNCAKRRSLPRAAAAAKRSA